MYIIWRAWLNSRNRNFTMRSKGFILLWTQCISLLIAVYIKTKIYTVRHFFMLFESENGIWSKVSVNGFAESLLPVLLWQVYLLWTSVVLFLAWSMRLHCGINFHKLTLAVAHSEMLLSDLENCQGKWIVLACCLHQMKSLLGTTSFQ